MMRARTLLQAGLRWLVLVACFVGGAAPNAIAQSVDAPAVIEVPVAPVPPVVTEAMPAMVDAPAATSTALRIDAEPPQHAASPVAAAAPARTAAEAVSAAASGAKAGAAAADKVRIGLPATTGEGQTALALRIVVGLTLLAVLPALLICTTAFLRIIIVLSMLRQAIGMPETPPNPVLIGLALFLTLFTMQPVVTVVSRDAVQPYLEGRIGTEAAFQAAARPMRDFMVRQTREHDLALMVQLSKAPAPRTIDDVSLIQLVPAYILSELRAAFQIGFVIFLPFLLIDLIVSSVLMTLGMMMMPPVTVALPLKILMFILVDGWSLVMKALVGSFH